MERQNPSYLLAVAGNEEEETNSQYQNWHGETLTLDKIKEMDPHSLRPSARYWRGGRGTSGGGGGGRWRLCWAAAAAREMGSLPGHDTPMLS